MPVGLFLDADVNECDTSPCSQECANVYGSYQCYCRQGFQLAEDGHSCKGEAAAFPGPVQCVSLLAVSAVWLISSRCCWALTKHQVLQVMPKDDSELHSAAEAAKGNSSY